MSNTPAATIKTLYLDLNSYFASVEQQCRPALRGKPVAVVPMLADSTCAIAASYEAKAFGISTGTPIWQAKQLCPELVCIPANHRVYVEYHQRIKAATERVLPITEICSIDEFYCQLMQNEQPLEIALKLAQNIKNAIQTEVGSQLRSSVGLAPNRFLAKVASNLQKPDGLRHLHADNLIEQLFPLPLTALPGVGPGMQRRLWRHGVSNMEQLWALSPKRLRKIAGSVWGERLWYLLRGYDIPSPPTKRSSISHSHVLAPQWRRLDAAYLIAKRLVLKAATRLRQLEYHTGGLWLSFRIENGGRYGAEVRFSAARDNATLQQQLAHLWQQLWQALPAGAAQHWRVKKVGIVLFSLTPEHQHQPSFWDVDSIDASNATRRAKQEQLSTAMDAINSRYGKDTITPADLWCLKQSIASDSKVAFNRIPAVAEFVA